LIILEVINDDINFYQYKKLLNNNKINLQDTSQLKANSTPRSFTENLSQSLIMKSFEKIRNNIVLLADDNHIINESNKRIINKIIKHKQIDLEIITCTDGVEILKYISDEEIFEDIKIIITDENMEYLNGSEAIKIIRGIEQRKKCPKKLIISLTCHEDNDFINNIKQSGADFIITKPLSIQKISGFFEQI